MVQTEVEIKTEVRGCRRSKACTWLQGGGVIQAAVRGAGKVRKACTWLAGWLVVVKLGCSMRTSMVQPQRMGMMRPVDVVQLVGRRIFPAWTAAHPPPV
jgi:hypothetical protein